jgi:hypothetical protein
MIFMLILRLRQIIASKLRIIIISKIRIIIASRRIKLVTVFWIKPM